MKSTRSANRGGIVRPLLVFTILASTLGVSGKSSWAQPARGHVFLPPTRGATVMSTYIDSHARMLVALGDHHESIAIARRHHAAAAEHEMRNAVQWVETYFKRKELNRAYRLKQNPPYLDQVEDRAQVQDRKIRNVPDLVLQGNVTEELNWLLNRLATDSLAYQLWFGEDGGSVGEEIDQELSPNDIKHINLTEAVGSSGSGLTFRADTADVLDSQWPLALRRPEFADARGQFENARDDAIRELRAKGELSYASYQRLQNAVDELTAILNQVYSRENVRTSSDYLRFRKPAENFLKAQAVGVYRAMVSNNLEIFRGDYRFNGDTVIELIQHACRHGLQFAPSEMGDEPTYRKLLIAMRHIYMHFQPQPDVRHKSS